jgi:tetratricopeptide (TPR) repeat protein
MAIEKVEEGKKFQLTKEAIIQLVAAGTLFLLSIVLGWFGFSNWRFKSALVSGYRAYESGKVGEAKTELRDAVAWKSEHAGARELLAKLAVDAGGSDLSAAEDQYKKLRELNLDSPTVKTGMGVLWLKKAEKATAPKEIADLVGRAQGEFRAAGNELPEGEIGLGHCDLLLASKLNDAKYLASARDRFEKLRTAFGSRGTAGKVSREGLIDYYSGLGRILAMSDKPKDLDDARTAFQSCTQLARRWELPRANMMVVEARRWAGWTGSAAEITAIEPEVGLRRRTLLNYWKDNRDTAALHRGPWVALSVAFAQALTRGGNTTAAATLYTELRGNSSIQEMPEPLLAELRFRAEMALQPGLKMSESDAAVRDALTLYDTLVRRLGSLTDDAAKDRKARALNTFAVMRSLQGTTGYKLAQDYLTEALKLYPDDYTYNRNLAIVLKRAKAAPALLQPVVDKAKAAAPGAGMADDFEKVVKVLDEK